MDPRYDRVSSPESVSTYNDELSFRLRSLGLESEFKQFDAD